MGKDKRLRHLEDRFPNLSSSQYGKTSDQNGLYNCIAYAAGDTSTWWDNKAYWPQKAKKGKTTQHLVGVYRTLGYQVCDNGELEEGFEKVTIYANRIGNWKHAAKQLENGHWSSKLGEEEDIFHSTPKALEGEIYGAVAQFLKRPRAKE